MLENVRGFLFVADPGRAGLTITAADEYMMTWFAHRLIAGCGFKLIQKFSD
jgi:hypothetical protein